MELLHSPTPDARPLTGTKVLAGLVLAAGLVLCASSLAGGAWEGEQAPLPYVWRDVALVHLLCALPLAWALTVFIHRRVPAAVAVVLAAMLLGVSIVPFLGAGPMSIRSALLSPPSLGLALRATPALGLAVSAALVWIVLTGGRRARGRRGGWRYAAAVGGLGAVACLLPPSLYVEARCQHAAARLGELLEQSRVGEARTLVHGLLALDAGRKWNGRALQQVAADVDRVVAELESRVSVPLAVEATAGERLERARQLAMLGRTEAALDLLQTVREPVAVPEVANLRGTIHETRDEWEAALEAYRSAAVAWESQPTSAARAAGLLRAATGIAYCQRKLGHYAEAEAAYEQVLALSPTADSYFLLAQFYEDSQQTEKARAHARRAMELDPARYQQAGEKLIAKLAVYHFGCLGVQAAEPGSKGGKQK